MSVHSITKYVLLRVSFKSLTIIDNLEGTCEGILLNRKHVLQMQDKDFQFIHFMYLESSLRYTVDKTGAR